MPNPDYDEWVPDSPEWTPPESTPAIPEEDFISKLWRMGNYPLLDSLVRKATEPMMKYGESGTGLSNKASLYGGAELQSLGNMVNPINIGLGALTGGSNLVAGAAAESESFAAKQMLMRIAKAMETPGRLAAGSMVGHGLWNATDSNMSTPERLGGLVEAGLGGLGLRSRITVPKMEVLPAPETGLARVPPPTEVPGVGYNPDVPVVQDVPYRSTPDEILRQSLENQPVPKVVPKYIDKPTMFGKASTRQYTGLPETQVDTTPVWNPDDFVGGGIAPQEPEFSREIRKPVQEVINPDEPQFARSELGGVKISTNVRRNANEVTTGYSAPLPGIMVREGMQNAIDAVRHLGDSGRVGIKIDDRNNAIEISDNGKGMDRAQIEKEFTTLHESGKEGEAGATGGKGIGKASYMLGGEHFEMTTVKSDNAGNKTKYSISGTPDEFFEHVPVDEVPVPKNTPTGTTIRFKLKADQEYWSARHMLELVKNHTRGVSAGLTHEAYGNNPESAPFHTGAEDKVLGKAQFTSGGTNDVSIIKAGNVKNRDSATGFDVHILNNGMYQYTTDHYFGEETPNIPREVIVNIHPHAEEGTAEYPFPANRESIKDTLKADIKQLLDEVIVRPQKEARKSILKELYEGMTEISPDPRDAPLARESVLFDAGDRLTPEERAEFTNHPIVKELAAQLDYTIDEMLKSVNDPAISRRLNRTGIILDASETHSLFGIHIPNPDKEFNRSAILINFFEHLAQSLGGPITAADEVVTTIKHELGHIGIDPPNPHVPVVFKGLDDPRVGDHFASYLDHMNKQGGKDTGHASAWMRRVGDIYARTGPEQRFDAIDAFAKIFSEGNIAGGYGPEVQRLLSIYKESRGRPATTEDILSRTGEYSKSPKGPEGDVPRDDNPIGNGPTGPEPRIGNQKEPKYIQEAKAKALAKSIEKLKEGIKLGLDARRQQDLMYSAERARRAAAGMSVKTPGLKGYYEQLGMLKGELPKMPSGSQLQQNDVDNLIDAVTNSDLNFYDSMNAKSGLLKVMTGRAPQLSELRHLEKVFGKDVSDIIMLHGGIGMVPIKDLVSNMVNVPKSIMASIDLSAPLRQGLPLIHKGEWWDAFQDMFKYAGSEKMFQDAQDTMMKHPNFKLWNDVGLFIAGVDDLLDRREEQFLSPLAERIPGIGPLIRGSERAYVGFLNQLRFDTANSLLGEAIDIGHPVVSKEIDGKTGEVKEVPSDLVYNIANFVNVSTGRGNLGPLEKYSKELNMALFSPRMISSRLTMLNPMYYTDKKTHPFVRKEAVKALLAVAAAGLVTTALLKRAGAQVSSNPISSDFGKSKFGNTRVDPWTGFQQYVVAAARFVTGKTTSTSGVTRDLGSGVMPTRLGAIAGIGNKYSPSLLENKMSPVASFVDDMLSQRTFPPGGVGGLATDLIQQHSYGDKPVGFMQTPKRFSGEVINRYTMMFLSDLVDIYRDNPNLLPLGILGGFGMSVQTFGPKSNPTINSESQQANPGQVP